MATTTQLAMEPDGPTMLLAFDDLDDSNSIYVQSSDLNVYAPLSNIPEKERGRLEECKVRLQETGREVFRILSMLPISEIQRDYEG